MNRIIKLILPLVILILLCSCNETYQTQSFMAMDTYIELKAATDANTLDEVKALTEQLADKFDAYSNFELNQLNVKGSANASKEMLELITLSNEYAHITDGAFNAAMFNLTSLWKEKLKLEKIPSQAEINDAIKSCNFEDVKVSDNKITLLNNTKIDFGAIAKGYISQKAVDLLKAKGTKSAVLAFGGNIALIGKNQSNNDWKVAIKNPKHPNDEHLGVLQLNDCFVVTSGNYERYKVIDNKEYHHILAKDGYPADNGIISVTIVCKDGTKADALSTALFVMGLDKAFEFHQSNKDFEAVLVTDNNKVHVTDGLKQNFELLNGDFSYEN